jgi:hypothetical protein
MASTNFQDYNENNPIVSSWLNDINKGIYTPAGVPKTATQSAAAFVRFSIVGGVVAIEQSVNVSTVTRTSAGIYTINYAVALTGALNAYGFSIDEPGFVFRSGETAGQVTIGVTNPANTSFDPNFVSVIVFGAN